MLKENKELKEIKTATLVKSINSLFVKENYVIMLAGLAVIAIGFILMAGGKSADPKLFDPKEVYSTTRITIAPLLIVLGFVIEIVGILKKPKQVES